MSRLIPAAAVALAILAASCCCCCCDSWFWDWDQNLEQTYESGTPVPRADRSGLPEASPVITRERSDDLGAETLERLAGADVPVRDLHELAIRLRHLPADTPRTIDRGGASEFAVGSRRLFHVSNVDTDEQFDLYAVLEAKTTHAYMWVEEGVAFDSKDLEDAADLFEKHTYATDRSFFGSEWTPGVDNDPHISILHARNLGDSVAGYYSSADEFVAAVREDSNEMEMFYINIDNVTVNSGFYNGVLAHEFQHMIHWHNDRNEETWLNEGFSELAMYLNDFDTGDHDWYFSGRPDTQLNSWPEGAGVAGANYGAAFLYTSYFLDRFGKEATQALVAHPDNAFSSVDAVLEERGEGVTAEDLFADWVIANLLDDTEPADGRYGYEDIDLFDFQPEVTYYAFDYPVSERAAVHQFATDYIELEGDRPLELQFTGSSQVRVVDASAHSGRYAWWSNRGDDSDMTLTRRFDLSGVSAATLDFWAWYDLEEDWDYAYVEISTDGGETWEILETPSGSSSNPNGNSSGWAYSGQSGGESSRWIHEQVDLSAFVGGEVQIRFEYITDDAVNRPGFLIDDVRIPEIGYSSDFEAGDDGWQAAGFVRHANVLPQRWLVQLVMEGGKTTVERLPVEPDSTGVWKIPMSDETERAVVAVSGLTPVTTELAAYEYRIETIEP
jgi:immune inhibitor A